MITETRTTTPMVAFAPSEPDAPTLLPFDKDAELAVLGALILDAETALPLVTPVLKPNDFYIVKHRWVFDAILALRERGESIDEMTVAAELERRGQLAELDGGPAFVYGLNTRVPTAYHSESYARIVQSESIRRHALHVADNIAKAAYDREVGALDLPGLAATEIAEWNEAQPTADRFKVHWADEALEPRPPRDWIVSQLFAAGSVNAIVGDGGTKKTWSMLDCAVAVANGERWLNFDTRRGVVLIVDEESGDHELKDRLEHVMRGHGVGKGLPLAYNSLAGFNFFGKSSDAHALHNLVRTYSARLVCIDALVDVMLGGDENKATDIQDVFHSLRVIANAEQCAINITHHANKQGGYRGSTAIKGAVDLLLTVDSKKDDDHINFSIEKSRYGKSFKFAALANFGTGTFNLSPDIPTKTEEHFSKSESYVLRYLREHGDSLMTDIEGHADVCEPSTAHRSVYLLVDRGLVRRVDEGKSGIKATFGLVKT